MKDYEILGIRENSSRDEIKKACRVLARRYHPDVAEDGPASSEPLLQINQSYQGTSSLFEWLSHEQFLHAGLFRDRQQLSVEIFLTPEEARIGGTVALTPRLEVICPVCHGACQLRPFECLECYGTGMITQKLRLIHRIPAGVYDGMLEYLSLEPFGFSGGEIAILYTVSYHFCD